MIICDTTANKTRIRLPNTVLCIHHKIAFDLGPDWKERWKIPEDISKIPQHLALGSGKEDFIKVFEKPKAKQSVAVVQINEEVNVRNSGFP